MGERGSGEEEGQIKIFNVRSYTYEHLLLKNTGRNK